jgi:Zn-dependent protease
MSDIDFGNPLLWAVLIGWIMSVVLHEWAHGIVAYFGGDYTIAERGGLTLNPLQYVDPFMSIVLPAIFLLMGGIPLPGGVTYIRHDLLRSRGWATAVALAGPGMNLLLFLACVLPLHPRIGWLDPAAPVSDWTNAQLFLASMAFLQLVAVILNLVPIPPLDGFQAIAPHMDEDARLKLSTPPTSTILFIGYFFVIWKVPAVFGAIITVFQKLVAALGFDESAGWELLGALRHTLWG